jgi:hypothetical protein
MGSGWTGSTAYRAVTHYHHNPSDPGSLGSNNVQTIYLDGRASCGWAPGMPAWICSIRKAENLSITCRMVG